MAAEVFQRFIFFGASVTIWDIVASCWGVSTIYPFARQLFCKQACWQGLPGVYIGGFLLTRQNTYWRVFYLPEQILGNGHCPMGNRDECCVFCGGQNILHPATVDTFENCGEWRRGSNYDFIINCVPSERAYAQKRLGRVKIQDFGFHMQHILRPSSLQCSDGISLLAAPLPSLWPIQAGWA